MCIRDRFSPLAWYSPITNYSCYTSKLPKKSRPKFSRPRRFLMIVNHLIPLPSFTVCTGLKPGIKRVQALDNISRSALCCHSNETGAPFANPPNSAQMEGTYHSPSLHQGPCSNVGMRRGTDRHTDTQTAVTTIHFASATPHAKCN